MFVGNATGYNKFQNSNIYANKNAAALMTAMQSSEQVKSASYAAKKVNTDSFVPTRSMERSGADGEIARELEAVGEPEFHAIQEKDTVTASWSATFDPSRVSEGTIVSINGVKFEFTSGKAAEGNEEVNIKDITKAEDIAKKFVDTVNGSADKIRKQSGWIENFAPEIKTDYEDSKKEVADGSARGTPVSCSWTKDGESGEWTLAFKQSEDWAHTDDKFDIAVDSSRLTDLKKVVPEYNIRRIRLENVVLSQIQSGDIIKIGDKQFEISLDSSLESDFKYECDDDGNGKISIKDQGDKSAWEKALSGASGYTVEMAENNSSADKVDILVRFGTALSSDEADKFNFDIVHKPETGNIKEAGADIKTPAYLQYEVSYEEFADGDNFKFNGVRFVFDKDNNTATPEIKSGQREKTSYVTADESKKTVTRLQSVFNNYFSQRKSGGVGKSTGAKTSGLQQAFSSIFALIDAGAFEMKVAFGDAGKATVFIYAKTKDILNEEGNIELEDSEGWKTADEVNEEAEAAKDAEGEEAVSNEGKALAEAENEAANVSELNQAMENGNTEGAAAVAAVSAINFSPAPVTKAPVSSEASNEPDGEPGRVSENTETADKETAGISGEDDAQKVVEDTKEKILENPGESLEAQASNLESEAVVQLAAS